MSVTAGLVLSVLLTAAPDPSLRGQHELALSVGVAPFDAFNFGVQASADYTFFFSRRFGLRALSVTYNYAVPTGITDQLERDFGVRPTAITQIAGEAHGAFVFAPDLVIGPNSELRLGFSLGAGAMLLTPGGFPQTVRPELAAGFELTWMSAQSTAGSLGLRLSFTDAVAVSLINAGTRPVNFASINLAVIGDLGSPR